MRRLRAAAVYGLVGALLTVALAWGSAYLFPLPGASISARTAASANLEWTVTVWRSIGGTLVYSSPHAGLNWAPVQMTGPPDAGGPGDSVRAWASLTADGQREWVRLDFAAPMEAVAVEVYESDQPGAVDRVLVSGDDRSDGVIAWEGADPTPASARVGVSRVPIDVDFPVRFVRIELDSIAIGGWNEIDAVALITTDGQRHWAVDADASSTYAAIAFPQPTPPVPPARIVPRWSEVPRTLDRPARGGAEVVEEARGMPFRALRCHFEPPAGPGLAWTVQRGIPLPDTRLLSSGMTVPSALPVHVIWTGLLLDVLILTLAARIVVLAVSRPFRAARHGWRVLCGRCPSCAHDLRYDFAPGCSECGWLREQESGG